MMAMSSRQRLGVGGRVAGIAPFDLSGDVGENVLNAFSPAVLSHSALNLIRGGSGAPNKILWKSHGSSSFFVIWINAICQFPQADESQPGGIIDAAEYITPSVGGQAPLWS